MRKNQIMTFTSEKPLMSVKQLAKHFGLHPMTVYRWVWAGKLQGIKIGHNVRFRVEDVEKFVQAGQ